MQITWTTQIGLIKRPTRYVLAAIAAIPIFGFSIAIAMISNFDPGMVVVLSIMSVFYAIFVVRIGGRGLDFSEYGVTVRNFFRARTYAWDQIERFQIKSPVYETTNRYAWLVTTDRKTHPVKGLEEFNFNVIGLKHKTAATRAVDVLNAMLEQVRRDGYDPSIDYFKSETSHSSCKL